LTYPCYKISEERENFWISFIINYNNSIWKFDEVI
jgi:hypothetical protein